MANARISMTSGSGPCACSSRGPLFSVSIGANCGGNLQIYAPNLSSGAFTLPFFSRIDTKWMGEACGQLGNAISIIASLIAQSFHTVKWWLVLGAASRQVRAVTNTHKHTPNTHIYTHANSGLYRVWDMPVASLVLDPCKSPLDAGGVRAQWMTNP